MCRSKSVSSTNSNKIKNLIKINVNNKSVSALIDSGAHMSCISETFYQESNLSKRYPLQKQEIFFAKGVSGSLLQILVKLTIPVEIGRLTVYQTFHVFQQISPDIILGIDFLREHKAVVHFSENKLLIQNGMTEVPLFDRFDKNIGLISTAGHVVLPART